MGDRCNFIISTNSTEGKSVQDSIAGNLVLYSHWGGYEAAADLKAALVAAKRRWDDAAYCARIIVSRIVGDSWKEETGFGLIVGEICDNEHPYLLVDIQRNMVRCEDREISFTDFVALDEKSANAFAGRESEEE